MNSLILPPPLICVLYIATGIQVDSVIFPLLTDGDKQSVIFRLPWQLFTSRDESLAISINKYPHILCGTTKAILQYKKCARKHSSHGINVGRRVENTDEGRPNVSYTLQMCSSCSFSAAAASEVIGSKCSQQLTYGNGKHMRNEKPKVKGSMV